MKRPPKFSKHARERIRTGMCVVIGCGNVSAPGSAYCAPLRCDVRIPWTLTQPELEQMEAMFDAVRA
jgi:hypothetical protein